VNDTVQNSFSFVADIEQQAEDMFSPAGKRIYRKGKCNRKAKGRKSA